MMIAKLVFVLLAWAIAKTSAKCYDPSPAFPVPEWDLHSVDALQSAFRRIETKLTSLVEHKQYDASSYSISVTSGTKTLFETFHSARRLNSTRPGVSKVDASSIFRIASISKVFTVLALLHQHNAGTLDMERSVAEYFEELTGPDSGALPWKDITLAKLASQLSGIPREFLFAEIVSDVEQLNGSQFGLPPNPNTEKLPGCGFYTQPCDRARYVKSLKGFEPVFAPNQKSTYSNVNFDILGMVIANVTNMTFENYIQEAIFDALGMSSATYRAPSDEYAVLPADGNFWGIDEPMLNPTGGIYSSNEDLTKFVRYILTHYNTLATGVNWLLPASWSTTVNSFYGMPFEIFRTDKILEHSRRPVTFTTKAGGLPGYFSKMLVLEEYGLGVVALVGGKSTLLEEVVEIVTVELVRAAEEAIWSNMRSTYAGEYIATDSDLNTSIRLSSSASKGLYLKSFIANGTNVLNGALPKSLGLVGNTWDSHWHMQLIPTLLFKDERNREGEIYRAVVVPERYEDEADLIWNDFCLTDIIGPTYGGVPVNEFVFWHKESVLEAPAWRTKMKLANRKPDDYVKFVVQT